MFFNEVKEFIKDNISILFSGVGTEIIKYCLYGLFVLISSIIFFLFKRKKAKKLKSSKKTNLIKQNYKNSNVTNSFKL